ncbi:MAG: tetratricopeptide repeat protein [Acidithiobacillus sp.]
MSVHDDERPLDIMAMAGLGSLKTLLERAQAGDAAAQYNLGVQYFAGAGVPQNYLEAAKWYGAAADQGDAQAQFNLGLMFYSGTGIPKNIAYAYELFSLAARQGDERARQGMAAILTEVPPEEAAELRRLGEEGQAGTQH